MAEREKYQVWNFNSASAILLLCDLKQLCLPL